MDEKPPARNAGDTRSPSSGAYRRMLDPLELPGNTQGRVAYGMDLAQASDLIRETLILALIIAAPMLAIGLIVGVVVSLLQAVTQIQEQTLSLIPKLAAMIGAAIFLMPWIGHRLMDYAAKMFTTGLTQ
jgi:flagellar biosynthetic protein FliQ